MRKHINMGGLDTSEVYIWGGRKTATSLKG